MSSIPEVVWQQPPETPVNHHKRENKHNESANNTIQTTQELENKQLIDVASQTLPPKGFQLESSGTAAEQFREKSGNEQVLFLDDSNICPTDIQDSREQMMTTPDGYSNISPLISSTPHIEEKLMRDEQTNEMYLPLTSTVVLKRKQEMLYVPLNFVNNVTIEVLVDSRSYVSAMAQDELDTIKQKAPNYIFKIDDPPNFQIQVANGQLEKPLATTTFKFDIEDNTLAEIFVVMKKLTGQIIGLHFMRSNTALIDSLTRHTISYISHT